MNNIKKGIFWALFTALISGFSIFYNKQVSTKGIDPLIFNIIKNCGVAIILSLLIISLPERKKLLKLTFTQWKKLFFIGVIGGSVPFILFFEGLKQVSAINANLIHKTLFIWVAAMAIPLLNERLNFLQIIGYLIIIWSNFFIGDFSNFSLNNGTIMIIAATLLWSLENIIAKITLKSLDSKILAWGRMLFGVLILIGIAIFQNKLLLLSQITSDQLVASLGSILLLTGYVLTWYKALKSAPATTVTSILILSTPITNILTAIFITHALSYLQLINLVLTLLGILGIVLIALFIHKSSSYEVEPRKRFNLFG